MSDLLILKDHFQRSFVGAGLAVPSGVFEALASRYSEPTRTYHTLQHIGEGIGHLKTVRFVPPEIPIAWWFHDAIYDPRRQDNEDKSAAWASAVLGNHVLGGQGQAGHPRYQAWRGCRRCGARGFSSMSILPSWRRPNRATANTKRKSAANTPSSTKRSTAPNARRCLRGFSGRAYIYATPEFRNLETRARKNIERSINALIVAKK